MQKLSRTIVLLAAALAWLPASAQERVPGEKEKRKPASAVQKMVEEWVLTRQIISRESTAWDSEKQSLAGLNGLRQQEIEQLGAFVAAAESRVNEIEEKRKEFADEEKELKAWRSDLESSIADFETRLRAQIPRLPPPLRLQVEEAVLRLETPDPERPLQNRTRDVLVVMQALLNFDHTVTVDRDLREIAGMDREVEVLYLGMAQAWYVDLGGTFAGTGVPTDEGWKWIPDNALADGVRKAIDVHSRVAEPAFVTLPLSNTGKESE